MFTKIGKILPESMEKSGLAPKLAKARVLSIFEGELAGATVIHFGRNLVLDCSWDRTLHIIEQPGGPCFHAGLPPATRTVAAAPTGTEPAAATAGAAPGIEEEDALASPTEGVR